MDSFIHHVPALVASFFGLLGALWSQSKRNDKDETSIRLIELLAGAAAGAAASDKYAENSGFAFSILVALVAGIVCGFVLDAADELLPESIRSFWKSITSRYNK